MADMDGKWPDLAGRIEGNRHVLPVRVYHEDTDFTGLVYHANYLKFMERARTEWLRSCGYDQDVLRHETGILFVVTRLDVRYRSPARYDDLLVLDTLVSGGGRARIDHAYELWRDREDGRGKTQERSTADELESSHGGSPHGLAEK